MMAQSLFKEQVLEFVEDKEEPFNFEFLKANCNQPLEDHRFWDALYEFEEEGKIVRLDHHYLSTRVMMRRWIRTKEKPQIISEDFSYEPFVPQGLIDQVEELMEQFGKTLKGRSDQGSRPNKR